MAIRKLSVRVLFVSIAATVFATGCGWWRPVVVNVQPSTGGSTGGDGAASGDTSAGSDTGAMDDTSGSTDDRPDDTDAPALVMPNVLGGGMVTARVDETQDGAVVLTAEPEDGWRFDHWEGDVTGDENPLSVMLAADATINAVFVRVYQLTVGTVGDGSVSSATGPHDAGSQVELAAVPDEGWRFRRWEGDAAGEDATLTIVIEDDMTVTAVFAKEFELTVAVEGDGSVTPDGGVFVDGETVTLTAAPAGGWAFDHWSGGADGNEPTVTVTLDRHRTVTAIFVERVELTIEVAGAGSVSGEGGAYDVGTQVALAAAADEGWVFARWEGDIAATGPQTLVTLDASKTVTAVFLPVAGHRAVSEGGTDGSLTLAMTGAQLQGTYRFGSAGFDVAGAITGLTMVLTVQSPVQTPYVLMIDIQPDGAWSGTRSGGGANAAFTGAADVSTGDDSPAAGVRDVTVGPITFPGRLTLTVDGSQVSGTLRLFDDGFDLSGTLDGDELTLTATNPALDPLALTATVQADGTLVGTLDTLSFEASPRLFP